MQVRVPEPILIAVLFLVAVLIGCSTALIATGNSVPTWFETMATLGLGGVLGAYQSTATSTPTAPGATVTEVSTPKPPE